MANSSFTPTVLTVPTTSTGGSGQGELNIVTNPSASSDNTGTLPSDWSNGTSHTVTKVATSSPLDPIITTAINIAASANIIPSAPTDGGGLIATTMPLSLRNRKLKLEFYYTCSASDTWRVDLYKGSTRVSLSTDSSSVTNLAAGVTSKFTAYFDSDSSTSYQVRWTRTAGTGTTNLIITQVIVGPGMQPQGAIVGEWQSYTPALTATTTNPTVSTASGKWRRIGSNIEVDIAFVITSAGSGTYLASLPTPLSVDYTAMAGVPVDYGVGTGNGYLTTNAGSTRAELVPGFNSGAGYTNKILLYKYNSSGLVSTDIVGGTSSLFIHATVPIAEWAGSGTVQLAQNDVEYVSYSGGTTVYSSQGSLIPNISVATTYTMILPSPVQSSGGWALEVKTPDGDGFYPLPLLNNAENQIIAAYFYDGTANRGMILEASNNSSQVKVNFAPTPAAGGQTWAALNSAGWRWRVRKSSAGTAVGFGLADTTSSGLIGTGTQSFAGSKEFTASQMTLAKADSITQSVRIIQKTSLIINSTIDILLFRNKDGVIFGSNTSTGQLRIYSRGASGADAFSGVYTLTTTGNGTAQATLATVSTSTRGTSPISAVNIANDGSGGTVKITATVINNALVTGGTIIAEFDGIVL